MYYIKHDIAFFIKISKTEKRVERKRRLAKFFWTKFEVLEPRRNGCADETLSRVNRVSSMLHLRAGMSCVNRHMGHTIHNDKQ